MTDLVKPNGVGGSQSIFYFFGFPIIISDQIPEDTAYVIGVIQTPLGPKISAAKITGIGPAGEPERTREVVQKGTADNT